MNNYMDDHAKYCCLVFKELDDDDQFYYDDHDRQYLTYMGDKLISFNYCPNCGTKL